MASHRASDAKHFKHIPVEPLKVLLKGYDWLCKCGESNYEEERECMACDKHRGDNEANYKDPDFINENDEE